MRKKFIIGNWKMNMNLADSQDFAFKLKNYFQSINTKCFIDIAICPPHVYLQTLANIFKDTHLHIGAQNMFYKEEGAYTGEISPKMLNNLKISLVILGHSERRQYFHETDNDINSRIKSALKNGLLPVFCVGEDLSTREKGQANEWVKKQVIAGLRDLNKNDIEKLVIAYEPIWAIGTGKICSGQDANNIIQTIRTTVKDLSSNIIAEKVRILYGGSIKSDNFSEHIKFPDIDGGLVGGSSLNFDEFVKIIDLANNAHELHPARS